LYFIMGHLRKIDPHGPLEYQGDTGPNYYYADSI